MPVLDDQGRIFGKVNIIDAAVLVVVGLLIPLAYGAYLLFRTPPAQVLAVEPGRVSPATTKEVAVRGQHLRPSLRMSVGPHPGTFFFGTPERAILRLPELAPGTYDVVLYDETQELGRLSAGLVVEEPWPFFPYQERVVNSAGELAVIGTFRALDPGSAKELSGRLEAARQRAMPWGAIRGFQRPEPTVRLAADAVPVLDGTQQIRAVLLLRCTLRTDSCQFQDSSVKAGSAVAIDISGAPVHFFIEEVHPIYNTSIELRVWAAVPAAVASQLGREAEEAFPARDALRPTYVSFEAMEKRGDGTRVGLVRLKLPAAKIAAEWYYRLRTLRIGDDFVFETPLYVVKGSIAGIREIGGLEDGP